MWGRFFDRLERILLSLLRGAPEEPRDFGGRDAGGASDRYMREAWEELNAYLYGEDRGGPRHRAVPDRLRQDYANLEVPFGAPFDEVRRSYRKLLRAYHPDRHASDPEKVRIATEITTKLNESYMRIRDFERSG